MTEIVYRRNPITGAAWRIRTRRVWGLFWSATVTSPWGSVMPYQPLALRRRVAEMRAKAFVDRAIREHYPDELYPPRIDVRLRFGQAPEPLPDFQGGRRFEAATPAPARTPALP